MENTRVRDIMTSTVIVAPPDMKVPAAIALMRHHGIRHLPVVLDGRLVGIVSRGDLREASTDAAINANSYESNFMLSRLTLGDIMTRRVFTVTPDAFIVHAAELLTENHIAGLPVVDKDGKVVGVVTDTDLLKLLVARLEQAEELSEMPGPTGG
jgi:CBS-domain-containing membrane protein